MVSMKQREYSKVELNDGTKLPYAALRNIISLQAFIKDQKQRSLNNFELIEQLASLEHDQWIYWSKGIAKAENISLERLARWEKLWTLYDHLSEADKEHDRVWARKVIEIIMGESKL